MSLKIMAQRNYLEKSEAPYFIHTQWSDTVEHAELVDIMAKGRTTLTKPDIAGCLELFAEEVAKLVADGKYVKTRLGAFYLCASGKLQEPDQAFTPGSLESGHGLKLHFRPERAYGDAVTTAAVVERTTKGPKTAPELISAGALASKLDLSAAAGEFIVISGKRLKFDLADPRAGVFFTNGTEHRAAVYHLVEPSRIIVQVPQDLAPGEYDLSVRTLPNGKDLRKSSFEAPFVVV